MIITVIQIHAGALGEHGHIVCRSENLSREDVLTAGELLSQNPPLVIARGSEIIPGRRRDCLVPSNSAENSHHPIHHQGQEQEKQIHA